MGLLKTNGPPFQDGIGKAAFSPVFRAHVLVLEVRSARKQRSPLTGYSKPNWGLAGRIFLSRSETYGIQYVYWPIGPWEILLFNTP